MPTLPCARLRLQRVNSKPSPPITAPAIDAHLDRPARVCIIFIYTHKAFFSVPPEPFLSPFRSTTITTALFPHPLPLASPTNTPHHDILSWSQCPRLYGLLARPALQCKSHLFLPRSTPTWAHHDPLPNMTQPNRTSSNKAVPTANPSSP